MESLAKTAGVSAPLVYNYFSNRPELLQALLLREYQRFADEFSSVAREMKNFEDIIRLSATSNLDHHAPGNILPLQLSQPEIASEIKAKRDQHSRQVARFLVGMAAEQYYLDQRQAMMVVSMSSGASIAAAELAANEGFDRNETIERVVVYILAGIERLARS